MSTVNKLLAALLCACMLASMLALAACNASTNPPLEQSSTNPPSYTNQEQSSINPTPNTDNEESTQLQSDSDNPRPTYSATEIYNQAIQYTGEITTYDKAGNEYALGTGFVYSEDGKIITNYHVIEGAYSATVEINDVPYAIISVLAYDVAIDLAVLQIRANGLEVAPISKTSAQVGETVYAIGSSRGMTNTYSQGIVTYADRVVDGVSHVQHDASITNGNSGGPLINEYGKVIGINTWGISDSQNLNFAINIDELNKLVYIPPISLAELTAQQRSPYQIFVDWIQENATDETVDSIYYRYDEDENDCYIISYNYYYESITIATYQITEKFMIWSAVTVRENDPVADCSMICEWNDTGETATELYGQLNISRYQYGMQIPYSEYYGYDSTEESASNLYSNRVTLIILWLNAFLNEDLGITLNDIGFASFE